MRRLQAYSVLIVLSMVLAASPSAHAGDTLQQHPLEPLPEEVLVNGPADPAMVEAAIRGLHEPIDPEQLSPIVSHLARIEDPHEQQRLQQLLDDQIAHFANLPETSGDMRQEPDVLTGIDPERLRLEIELLQLGPRATVDDLRKRDEVLSSIAGIPDPDVRYELLRILEDHERLAEELPAELNSPLGGSR